MAMLAAPLHLSAPRVCLSLAVGLACLAPASAQVDVPTLPDVSPGARPAVPREWLASDGRPAAPGRVPDGTDALARERFAKAVARLGAKAPVRSFTLRFDALSRIEGPSQEFSAEFSYLDEGPGWVRGATFDKADRNDPTTWVLKQEQMRGPQGNGRPGYWHRLKDGTLVDLVGPDHAESREQLDGWAALCHDLLLLRQPERLRLMGVAARSMTALEDPRFGAVGVSLGGGEVVLLPAAKVPVGEDEVPLAARACALEWLEVVTPDIRLFRDGVGVEAARRVWIGLDPSGLPELALLTSRIDGPLLAEGATLLHVAGWHAHGDTGDGGQLLPRSTLLYELRDPEGDERRVTRFVFATRPALDLYLVEGGRIGGEPPKAETFRPR